MVPQFSSDLILRLFNFSSWVGSGFLHRLKPRLRLEVFFYDDQLESIFQQVTRKLTVLSDHQQMDVSTVWSEIRYPYVCIRENLNIIDLFCFIC
ncbi:unnamed protein product [Lactuca virosa]|uniref:Uncharacterized protein n=1 Tax=Lactuca virosa TaxID=75947 RepID=A0AAU9M8X2_9ASTR|nr:unnamed protein product [Lactuca virosa]